MAGSDDVVIRISADSQDLEAALKRATASVTASVEAMKSSVTSFGAALDDIQSKISLAFAYEVITKAAEAIKGVVAGLDNIALASVRTGQAAKIIGVTRQELEGLHAAADEAGVGAERFDSGMEALELRLQQARDTVGPMRDKFAAVGITLADLEDRSFTTASALYKIGESSADSETKLDAVGRRAIVLLETLDALGKGTEAARLKAEAMGATTDQEAFQLLGLHKAIADAEIVWHNFETRLVAGVAPALTALITSLVQMFDVSKTGAGTIDTLAEKAREISKVFLEWSFNIQQIYFKAVETFQGLGDSIGNFFAFLDAVAVGHFHEAADIFRAGVQKQKEIQDEYHVKMLFAEEQFRLGLKRITESETPASAPPAAAPPSGQRAVTPTPTDVIDLSIEDEISKKMQAVMAEMQRAITTDAVDAVKAREEAAVGSINRELAAVHAAAGVHKITNKEELADTQALLEQEWRLQEDYYTELRSLHAEDLAELARINVEEEKAHQRHLDLMAKADLKFQSETDKVWDSMFSHMQSGFATAINKMIVGTASITQTMHSMFYAMTNAIASAFAEMAAKNIATMIKQAVVSHDLNLKEVMRNAYTAASGAYKAVVSIPYVGPILAPIAAAAAYAAVVAFGDSMPGAAGGYDIPAGINPVVQAHGEEMILPPNLANAFRDMVAGNRSDQGSGRGDVHHHHHYGPSLDAKSFHTYIAQPANREAMAKVIDAHFSRGGRLR